MKNSTIRVSRLPMLLGLWIPGVVAAQTDGAPMPVRGATLRIHLGLEDREPTSWDGSLEVSGGRVFALAAGPGRAGRVEGNSWRLRTRAQGSGEKRTLVRPVLVATLDAPWSATVSLRTPAGKASFGLADFSPGEPLTLLDGQVRVELYPPSFRLTEGPTDDDWPSAARGADGAIWVAYASYRSGPPLDAKTIHEERRFETLVPGGHGDRVELLEFDGSAWSGPFPVTGPGLDVWRPAVAVDGRGKVWTVWSQFIGGNWDLHARGRDPRAATWGETLRLTTAPGADVAAVVSRHPGTGDVHVVWQGWRDGSFDILHRVLGRDAPPERRLVRTRGNEWSPSAAFDSVGTLHVAFDTYEKGDYDVKLVSLSGRELRVITVAGSPRFEARPSLAVDRRDRVWVAYEEAGANWSKDTGLRWSGRKTERPYLWREVVVRCIDGGRVRQARGTVPVEPVTASYPRGSEGPRRRMALPRLAFDGAGRLWLLYRRHATTSGQGERWVSYATHHAGDRWSGAVRLENSANLLDNRPALVPVGDGDLLAIHSTDGRTRGSNTAGQNDLRAAVLHAPGRAADPGLVALPAAEESVEPVHPDEVEDVRRIREYRATVGGRTYRLLRGEFHRHTELTSHQDMDGPLEDMWRYAIDVAAMDWIGNGDHDNGNGVEYLWWLVQKQTDIYHHAPAFLPLFSYERSNSYPSGHRNALFAVRGIRPLPRIPGGRGPLYGTPEEGSPDIKNFYAYLKHFGGICASHTSGTGMGTDWRDNDPGVEPVVEIYQGLRQSYEHEGAPATARDEKDSIGGYQSAGFVWKALMKGYRLGFESSSDHYSTHISYSMVFAEAPTREAIIEGFRKRHSYAANDNIILDVRCGDHLMGDAFTLKGKPHLTIHVIGTQPIARVSVIRGVGSDVPRYVYDVEPGERRVTLDWTDEAPAWGASSYYYVRVEQARPREGNGALAWASPLWITARR